MSRHVGCAAVIAVVVSSAAHARQRPRDVVNEARLAVIGDSVSVATARWTAARSDPSRQTLADLGLATLHTLGNHYDSAVVGYQRIIDGAAPTDPIRAYARTWLGVTYTMWGQLARGDSLLTQAREDARAIGDEYLMVQAAVFAATAYARTRSPSLAVAILDSVRSRAAALGPEMTARHGCVLAQTLILQSDPRAAPEAIAAAEVARAAGYPRVRAQCLLALAADLQRRALTDSARVVYGEIVTDARRARDDLVLAGALQWRGYLYRVAGVYGRARADLLEAVEVGNRAGNLSAVGWSLSNLAILALDLGDLGSGAEYARRADSLFDRQGDRFGQQVARETLANLLAAAGELADARGLLRDAVARSETIGFAASILPARIALAHIAMREHDWAGAEQELAAARAAAVRYGMRGWDAALYYHQASLALRRGDAGQAEQLLAAGSAFVDQPDWAYYYAARRAEALALRGDLAGAVQELTAATDALDAWRSTLDARTLRARAFQRVDDLSDPDLGIATVISQLARNGRAEAAFQLAERRRARDLLDRLVRADALVSGPTRPEPTTARTSAPGLAQPIGVPGLMAAIPDDRTAVLEYVTGVNMEPTTLFVVTRDGLAAHRLPPADSLASAVEHFRTLAAAGENADANARELGTALLPAGVVPDGVDRLIIVADGILQLVPFAAMGTTRGDRVIERFSVSTVPSATVLLALWERPGREGASAMLALADPAWEAEGQVTPAARAFRSLLGVERDTDPLPSLPASRREVRSAAAFAEEAVVLEGVEAREAWVKANPLQDFAILHFATHAVVDEVNEGLTALALAPGEGEDGFLQPGELTQLQLNAALVVLSACRTAGGVVVQGEGLLGLAAPFLEAGARAVLATQWDIDDRVAGGLTRSFYRAMADGLPAGEALRAAKIKALRAGAPASEWAAFTLVGDPLAYVRLDPPNRFLPLALLAMAVLAAGVLVYGLRRRRAGR